MDKVDTTNSMSSRSSKLKTTPRSFDEIKAFLRGENPDEEDE